MIGELSLLKNLKKHNKLDFYKVINIILIIAGSAGFILPFFILYKYKNSSEIRPIVLLSNIIGYCRFLVGNKKQMITDIAIHNIAIAIFGFITSFFSRGILGCLILFFNLFVLGTVLCDVHTAFTIIFVSLELIGICIAVFGGTNLSKRFNKNNTPLKNILKLSIFIIAIIAIIYFIAASIESKIILNHWR